MNVQDVFSLRKKAKDLEGDFKLSKLLEAYEIATNLYSEKPFDEWVQKAFAYTLIDLCKYYISIENMQQAKHYFDQMLTIDFHVQDEIIAKQMNFLRPRIAPNHSEVQAAVEFSKNGDHDSALTIIYNLIAENKLSEIHLEEYGWIIYRLIKAKENEFTSTKIKKFLQNYLKLKNQRPSLLHSQILSFAIHYSKSQIDFNLYNFYLLWNPQFLREDDLVENTHNDKTYPALLERLFKTFAESTVSININELLEKTPASNPVLLDYLREPFFWKLFNLYKDNNLSKLWITFANYNQLFSAFEKSKWHSKVLSLAERYMQEAEVWRFLVFFKIWNPENLMPEDWKETEYEGKIIKPLAIKCLKKSFEIIKKQNITFSENWLFPIYSIAIQLFPNDDWLLRDKALLHIKSNEFKAAIIIYKHLVLELADKYYVWQEFSNCITSDNSLKLGMLFKAISLEKNEDFLGDLHLELAKALIDENLLENSLIELESYKKHRVYKGWKLSALYEDLADKVNKIDLQILDNRKLHQKYICLAENFAYEDIDWIELVLVDKWKDNNGRDRLNFTNGNTIEFSVGYNRFEVFKQTTIGQIFKFKLHKQEITKEVEAQPPWRGSTLITEIKYIPLIVLRSEKENWSILGDTFAVVDYINEHKNIIHAITFDNKEVFFPQTEHKLFAGDFITAKYFLKTMNDTIRTELIQIKEIEPETVISKFQTQIAMVDAVNENKKLFHLVTASKLQGIVKYSETRIRPNEGDFLKIIFVTKTGKDEKLWLRILHVESTKEVIQNLRKVINGLLQVKFKNYLKNDFKHLKHDDFIDHDFNDDDFDNNHDLTDKKINEYDMSSNREEGVKNNLTNDLIEKFKEGYKKKDNEPEVMGESAVVDNFTESKRNLATPDFGFVENYYVPKYLLERSDIKNDCFVRAKIIYTNYKWKVIHIIKI